MIYVSNESSMKKVYKKIFDEKLLLLYVANNGCISRGINWMDDTFVREKKGKETFANQL